MTSLGEALEHLGPPARLSASGDGLAMLYEYNRVEEFQIGFNFDQPGLEYIKLVSARGWLEHEALLLFFDERGILRSIGREQWRQPLGSGGAAQILVALSSLVDSSRARRANPQHTWGAALLAPLPTTLNAHHGPHTGSSGLEQTLAPDKVGQRTLEMGASPALPERFRE
jgi:hypothetical protein